MKTGPGSKPFGLNVGGDKNARSAVKPVQKRDRSRQTVDISSMFRNKRAVRHAKQSSSGHGRKGRHKHPSVTETPPHPLADTFNDRSAAYQETVHNTQTDRLESMFEDLTARLSGTTSSPTKPAQAVPAALKSANDAALRLIKPLGEDLLRVRFKDSSSRGSREEDIALGTTMARFEDKVAEKKAELERLLTEWERVQAEIAGVARDLLRPYTSGEKGSLVDELELGVARLKKDVKRETAQRVKEVEAEIKHEAELQKKRKAIMNESLKKLAQVDAL